MSFAIAAIAFTAAPAAAQNMFESFFGSFGNRRWSSPPAYADPFPQFNPFGQRERTTESQPSAGSNAGFCVRLCDGRFFPIARNTGATPAQTCNAFCPATATKVYNGSTIDHAVAAGGQRYADLNTAFVYREKIVAGCTCNGKDAFGLVTPSANDDPTLHTGDIVATNSGFVAVSGGRKQNAEFTPIQNYSGLSAEMKQRLAETKIVPANATPVAVKVIQADTTASVPVSKTKRVQAPSPAQNQPWRSRWFW